MVEIEKIIAEYRNTGSVWKTGKVLGICGQSVWERLSRAGHTLGSQEWSAEEVDELSALAGKCTIGEIARRLGRPYAGVALKISRLGLGSRYGNKLKKERKREILSKARALELWKLVPGSTLRQVAIKLGLDLESVVHALQKHTPEQWREFAASKGLSKTSCPYCGVEFHPVTKKQKQCSRACAARRRTDGKYFGGKRRNTVGLAEGVCQLCRQAVAKGLSSHHIFGKEHDPENDYLIAVCRGCHEIITLLSSRKFITDTESWEDLISLVLMRRHGARFMAGDIGGIGASVEIEEIRDDGSDEAE